MNDRELLATYLASRNEPCPLCRYDLHNLQGATCPECGAELRLRVGLERPQLAAYLTGLIGIASAIGFTALMFLWTCAMSLYLGPPPETSFVYVPGIAAVAFGILLFIWLRSAKWLRQRRKAVLWRLALCCLLLPIASLVLMIWLAVSSI